MTNEDKVLNGYGVLYALMLSRNIGISPDTVISLLNEAGKE